MKSKKIRAVGDELSSLTARTKVLLCNLLVGQWILLCCLPDSSQVNRLYSLSELFYYCCFNLVSYCWLCLTSFCALTSVVFFKEKIWM